jgi:hypothetical protein
MRIFAVNPVMMGFLLAVMPVANASGAETGRASLNAGTNTQNAPDTLSEEQKLRDAALREERRLYRDSAREERRAIRDSLRAEKHRAWEEQRAVRDQGRRAHNIAVGAVFEKAAMEFPKGRIDNYNTYEVTGASLLGLSIGYRSHFLSKLGYEAGAKIMGANGVTNDFDDCKTDCDDGYLATVEARLLGGPLGRFLVMPSIGYTIGKYTTGRGEYYPSVRHSVRCANVGLGLGLYFGSSDEISVIAELGFGIGSTTQTLGILRLAYAFQVPR